MHLLDLGMYRKSVLGHPGSSMNLAQGCQTYGAWAGSAHGAIQFCLWVSELVSQHACRAGLVCRLDPAPSQGTLCMCSLHQTGSASLIKLCWNQHIGLLFALQVAYGLDLVPWVLHIGLTQSICCVQCPTGSNLNPGSDTHGWPGA